MVARHRRTAAPINSAAMLNLKILTSLTFALLIPALVAACPLVDELVDYNCDGVLRYAIAGDSIVRGVGDERNLGGYPGRLDRRLEFVTVNNLGTPGITSLRLYRRFLRNIDKGRPLTVRTQDLDLLIIQVGTNDFWLRRPVNFTFRNIRRLKNFLEEHLTMRDGASPYVVVSTIPPTRRSFQQPFIDDVNRRLLGNARNLNAFMRLHNFNTTILSGDDLHPNASGYNVMARRVERRIKGPITKRMLEAQQEHLETTELPFEQ